LIMPLRLLRIVILARPQGPGAKSQVQPAFQMNAIGHLGGRLTAI
jgi:hypothetical protein